MASKTLSLLNQKQNVPNLNGMAKLLEPVTYNNPYAPKKKKAPVELTESYGVDNTPKTVDVSNTPASIASTSTGSGDVDIDLMNNIKKYQDKGLKYSKGRGVGCTDCSMSVQSIMKDTYNIDVGSTTLAQRGKGVKVFRPKMGDLVHFDTNKNKKTGVQNRHVGIMLNDGNFWHFGPKGYKTSNIASYGYKPKYYMTY